MKKFFAVTLGLIASLATIASATPSTPTPMPVQNQLIAACAQPLNAATEATINQLISAGADINAPDTEVANNDDLGQIIFHNMCLNTAAKNGNLDMVNFVLSLGAQILKATETRVPQYGPSMQETVFDNVSDYASGYNANPLRTQVAGEIVDALTPQLVKELKAAQ